MITDYLETIIEAESIEAIWDLQTQYLAGFGFDRVIYGFTRFWSRDYWGDPDDIMVLSNHPAEYTEAYVKEGYYFKAPLVKWAMENNGACSWTWTRRKGETEGFTKDELEVIEFNKKYEVSAGYTISYNRDYSRDRAAMALSAKPGVTQEEVDALWEKHGREITLACNVFHMKALNMPHSYGRATLTNRQREVLEWAGEGKNNQDIGTIMGLTSATVEKHLRLARKALDVETTAQAVLKASFQNQIYIIEA